MKKNLALVLLLSFLLPLCTQNASADDNAIVKVLKQTSGVVLGVGIGPVVGGARGLTKGWLSGTDKTADVLGDADGLVQRSVGAVTGGVVIAAAGAASGVLMGAYDGIQYGWDKPLSKENFSYAGKFTEYEPFKW